MSATMAQIHARARCGHKTRVLRVTRWIGGVAAAVITGEKQSVTKAGLRHQSSKWAHPRLPHLDDLTVNIPLYLHSWIGPLAIVLALGAPFDPTARARELDNARASYSQLGLGGPIVLMSASFTLAIPVTLVGLVANALGENPTLLVAGIGLGVVGIGSASWLGHRLRDRRVVGARIRALEETELGQLSLGIKVRPENAGLSLHMRF